MSTEYLNARLGPRRKCAFVFGLCCTLVLQLSVDETFAQGKLSGVRAAVRPQPASPPAVATPPSSPPPAKSKTDHDDHRHHDHRRDDRWRSSRRSHRDGDDSLGSALLGLGLVGAFTGATSPFWVPHQGLDDDLSRDGYFPDFPYHETDGSMELSKKAPGFHDTLVILRGQYGNDFGGLSHVNGRLLVDTASRFGLDTEVFYRHEDLTRGSDHLWTGDANLTYRFAQNDYWQFRAGMGVNWLSDRFGTEDGFNFTYGMEFFPLKPWVVTADLDWGKIGNAKLFHGRTTIGVTQDGWGLFTGYDFLRIDKLRSHTWINGIEYRF